jgi:hypothetical protein
MNASSAIIIRGFFVTRVKLFRVLPKHTRVKYIELTGGRFGP